MELIIKIIGMLIAGPILLGLVMTGCLLTAFYLYPLIRRDADASETNWAMVVGGAVGFFLYIKQDVIFGVNVFDLF